MRSQASAVPAFATAVCALRRLIGVDPLGLRYVKGHVYFIAYDHKRADYVPFKLNRISTVDVLADKAGRSWGSGAR